MPCVMFRGGMLWECATEQVACMAAIGEAREARQRCAATCNSTYMNRRLELHRCVGHTPGSVAPQAVNDSNQCSFAQAPFV
jgi:hypothetical protein